MANVDTNVDNYTIEELLSVLDLDDPSEDEIMDTTNEYIEKYEKENNDQMVAFFQNAQTKLLQYTDSLKRGEEAQEYSPNNAQTKNWFDNQVLRQSDKVQADKNTDRKQKIDIYDNQHVPMNREQLGVNNTIDTGVAQDTLNPNLKNVTSRVIVLDSQFRQTDGGSSASTTDYTLDLSETLNNVISLRLYSLQIPVNWYAIDTIFGNTCLWVTNYDVDGNSNTFLIEIAPGNYTAEQLVTTINTAFLNPLDPITVVPIGTPFIQSTLPFTTYNQNNGKLTFNLNGATDPYGNVITGINIQNGEIVSNTTPFITFFDFTRKLQCKENCASPGMYFDRSLGWIMGFRLPISPILANGNTGVAIVNLFGSKYFILIIDDYNQNHINNGIVNIAELSKKLSMPSYYTPDMPYTCTPNLNNINNITNFQNSLTEAQALALGININNISGLILEQTFMNVNSTPTILPSAPRTLTQAQIYTINEIIKNREKTTSYRGKPPSSSDALAVIPLKVSGNKIGDMYVEFGGSLQDNKRVYFGPVNIDRFHVKLLDDKGYVVNLNGGDWCVTLISENLYQY
jgi:hypothetical protein